MTGQIDKDLLDIKAYPEPTTKVELVQTHISYVFVADEFVYKVKKPVDFGFVNFSTLEKRRYFCDNEIRLNRRLSPRVYLGVVPVTEDGGRLVLGGKGKTVDYAVKMKRLPMDRLMIKLLQKGQVTEDMLWQVAKKIADFHGVAELVPNPEQFGTLQAMKFTTDENFDQTERYKGITIEVGQFDRLKEYTNRFYREHKALFENRIKKGKIKDCHGDLHMEHICFTDPITIFDCIEFNDRFRYIDTASDIAFLAMDLDFHTRYGVNREGNPHLSRILIDDYVRASGDDGVMKLLAFHKAYRAYVRGKVISFRLDDEHISAEDKKTAADTAKKYFELADSYVTGSQ